MGKTRNFFSTLWKSMWKTNCGKVEIGDVSPTRCDARKQSAAQTKESVREERIIGGSSPKKNECIPHRCCARDAENRTPTFKKKKKPATRNGKTQTSKRGFTDKQTVFSDEHTGKRRKREGWQIYRKAHCDFAPTAALLFTPYIYNTAHSRFSAPQPTLFRPSSSVAFHTFIRLRTSICLSLHRYTPFRPSSPLTKKEIGAPLREKCADCSGELKRKRTDLRRSARGSGQK